MIEILMADLVSTGVVIFVFVTTFALLALNIRDNRRTRRCVQIFGNEFSGKRAEWVLHELAWQVQEARDLKTRQRADKLFREARELAKKKFGVERRPSYGRRASHVDFLELNGSFSRPSSTPVDPRVLTS